MAKQNEEKGVNVSEAGFSILIQGDFKSVILFFFFKQKTAYEISACLVGSGSWPGACIPLRAKITLPAASTTAAMVKSLRTVYFTQLLFSNSPSRNSGAM